MRVHPIRITLNKSDKFAQPKDFVPTWTRYNNLHDIEFDIIADKIRAENLKNQMNLKLAQIKKSINNFINKK